MGLLLSFESQQGIKPISGNNSAKYPTIAKEVEALEITKLLGVEFYQAVSASPTEYLHLLDEYSFTNSFGRIVKHNGLRYVIAYLNFSKYVGESYINDTFSGFTKKNIPESEQLNEGERRRLQGEYRQIALTSFETIREYLNLNKTTYPLWGEKSDNISFTPKFYSVTNKTKYYEK